MRVVSLFSLGNILVNSKLRLSGAHLSGFSSLSLFFFFFFFLNIYI